MTSIDSLNNLLTIISIIVTIISVICSISASSSAKAAKQYKEETLQLKDTFDLERILGRFQIGSKHFQNHTRKNDWYKGIDVNTVISPFTDILSDFGKVYHLMEDHNQLKSKVHSLNEIVQMYTSAKNPQKKEVTSLIIEITDLLQQELHRNTNKIVKC